MFVELTSLNFHFLDPAQWVETKPSNICICPMDIRFAAWWYYADGYCRC